jgi:hypothetical protein
VARIVLCFVNSRRYDRETLGKRMQEELQKSSGEVTERLRTADGRIEGERKL